MQPVDQSVAYYRLRAAQEREAAEKAADEKARQIHTELASKYDQLADLVSRLEDERDSK